MIENPEIIKLREKPNKSKAHNRSMHQFEIAKKKKKRENPYITSFPGFVDALCHERIAHSSLLY